MSDHAMPRHPKLWIYSALPAVILNLGALAIYGGYYALAAVSPEAVADIPLGYPRLAADVLIFAVEWVTALGVIFWLRRNGLGLRALISPTGHPLHFRWGPAILMFLALNGSFAVYMILLTRLYGDLSAQYAGLGLGARIAQVALIPLTAGFCEELIWRGHVQTQLLLRGRGPWPAILLMSLSFALIHGVFFPDKLAITFLLGIIAGWYYQRERNLLPLMVAHMVLDLWSFGLTIFG